MPSSLLEAAHLEPLRLVELDGGLILSKALVEDAALNFPLLVEIFFLAVDAANHVDVRVVFEVVGTEALQVGELEQRLVVGGCGGVRPLQVEGLLLPVLAEELLRPHGLDEALKQAAGAEEAQGGGGGAVLDPALFREQLLLAAPSLQRLLFAPLWHFNLKHDSKNIISEISLLPPRFLFHLNILENCNHLHTF